LTDRQFEVLMPQGKTLAAFYPANDSANGPPTMMTVFIEGDGASWPAPSVPPADPTPGKPLGLQLALAHADKARQPGEAVAYLGRPCQYLTADALGDCPVAWWTRGRFGDAPMGLLNARLDDLQSKAPKSKLRLVGYSGGGAVAALLAAQRADVACLVTVAAPLDTEAWTRANNVSQLSESRNPLMTAAALRGKPMAHFVGSDDTIVPSGVNARFLQAAQSMESVEKGVDHEGPWLSIWARLARQSCLGHP
jgi:pimeloyl-ACP methyl ester carboxylesterase